MLNRQRGGKGNYERQMSGREMDKIQETMRDEWVSERQTGREAERVEETVKDEWVAEER